MLINFKSRHPIREVKFHIKIQDYKTDVLPGEAGGSDQESPGHSISLTSQPDSRSTVQCRADSGHSDRGQRTSGKQN